MVVEAWGGGGGGGGLGFRVLGLEGGGGGGWGGNSKKASHGAEGQNQDPPCTLT